MDGKGLVEGRVKVSDTRDAGEFIPAQAHDFQGGEIVSKCHTIELVSLGNGLSLIA